VSTEGSGGLSRSASAGTVSGAIVSGSAIAATATGSEPNDCQSDGFIDGRGRDGSMTSVAAMPPESESSDAAIGADGSILSDSCGGSCGLATTSLRPSVDEIVASFGMIGCDARGEPTHGSATSPNMSRMKRPRPIVDSDSRDTTANASIASSN
jgi:hypothetical protein